MELEQNVYYSMKNHTSRNITYSVDDVCRMDVLWDGNNKLMIINILVYYKAVH